MRRVAWLLMPLNEMLQVPPYWRRSFPIGVTPAGTFAWLMTTVILALAFSAMLAFEPVKLTAMDCIKLQNATLMRLDDQSLSLIPPSATTTRLAFTGSWSAHDCATS